MLALWRTGLLLSFLTLCASLEEDCVLGIVGRPVSLPCSYRAPLPRVNFSIEWRRDGEAVLRSEWGPDGRAAQWSTAGAALSPDAALTEDFSLDLSAVDPAENQTEYTLVVSSGEGAGAAPCTVCLRTAAGFSSPLLQREAGGQGQGTAFVCHSIGGFPKPAVSWLINDVDEPPEGAVRTLAAALPDSHLYNVTSHLTLNVSRDSRVSCIIENASINQTLTSTTYGVDDGPVMNRASEAMWIFSTALCAVVGVMVMAGVAYQIHLDRISRRKKDEYQQRHSRGHKGRHVFEEEMEAMKPEPKETDV